jgi:hypothetical protein
VAELPQRLLRFIRHSVPTYQAAEVLLFLARHEERWFTLEEVAAAMSPSVVTLPALREYAAVFAAAGVVAEQDGRFTYRPESPDTAAAVGELATAYNERPVTLIKTIYRIADSRIQSFSDSFKLRED